MKWIGQHIWSFISRFRSDVYLDSPTAGGSDPDKFLGIDSNNKIIYRTGAEVLSDIGAGAGDITGVTITTDSGGGSAASDTAGSADFSILGANGVGVTNSGTTITAAAVPGEIDHDSLLNFASNEHFTQANITTVGTIDTGVWEGTAIASDQQKHIMHYQTVGYATGATNYEIPKQMSANTAPFQHDQDIGSDGLTAQTVQIWMRAGGHVMPRACTLKRWTGWATSSGSATTYIALFKVTPTRNNNSNVSAVLLEEFSYTALGNAKMEDFDETSFTETAIAAGDIVFTAMKGSGSAQYFNGTFEVEF